MTSRYKSLLPAPEDISDETAAVLTGVLSALASVCEVRYLDKILRHQAVKLGTKGREHDPDRPWERRPPD
jgi:hypothetical protein